MIKDTNGKTIVEDGKYKSIKEAVGREKDSLYKANLFGASLSGANLARANLIGANLRGADLTGANLNGASLIEANLGGACLVGANLSRARLSRAKMDRAYLFEANLSGAYLFEADLTEADLSKANLACADLSDAVLLRTNLSGAKGLLNPSKWMKENFKMDEKGYIVYKAIGTTTFSPPSHWKIKPEAFLEEVVNPLPTISCGCGVNFATREWLKRGGYMFSKIWKCRINWEDLVSVVVPYNTNGKARCGRLELLEIVK